MPETPLPVLAGDVCEGDAAPEDVAPRDAAPEDVAPEAAAPEDTTPEDATPEDATPEDAGVDAVPCAADEEPEAETVETEDPADAGGTTTVADPADELGEVADAGEEAEAAEEGGVFCEVEGPAVGDGMTAVLAANVGLNVDAALLTLKAGVEEEADAAISGIALNVLVGVVKPLAPGQIIDFVSVGSGSRLYRGCSAAALATLVNERSDTVVQLASGLPGGK